MRPPGSAHGALAALAIAVASLHAFAAGGSGALRPSNAFEDRAQAERGLVIVRLDPKGGARPGECDDLAVSDLAIAVGRLPAKVVSVERVPRPERHWLLLDISESAEGRRLEAMRSALQYVKEVMSPGEDAAAIVTVDEDPILVAGPTSDPAELEREIANVPPGGWSALRDGLDTVLRQVVGDRHEHVILYWTDGEDQASVTRADDLLATLARTPNATVFPISLLPKGAKFPPPPMVGATFTEVARRSGGEVGVSSDPRWLDRVRGWLGRRFTVSFVPPPREDGGRSASRKLVITVPRKRCEVTLLPDPFGRPDPIAGEAPPPPAGWTQMHARTLEADDPGCAAPKGSAAWDWPLTADATGLSGCVLDVVQASGPIVRERNDALVYKFQSPRLAAREIRVAAPPFAALPTDPAEAIASILSDLEADDRGPSRYLMDGGAFLAQRAQFASSLFARRADYRDFAVDRLNRYAQTELRALERDFKRAFPELPPDQIAAVARASRAGTRFAEASRTPTDADLERVLAAWIADVSAADLLRGVERRLIDQRLSGGADPWAESRWASVRARFAVPVRVRIVTPLVLIHDPAQDIVGFVRVVLPRPESFRKPDPRPPAERLRESDRLVRRPLALRLVEDVAADPEIGAALAARGYRVASIEYGAVASQLRHEPARPYEQAHVVVRLDGRPREGGDRPRAVLEADVRASAEGPVTIAQFAPRASGDPELDALLGRLRATPRPRNRPKRAPCCGRRRGSCRARGARG